MSEDTKVETGGPQQQPDSDAERRRRWRRISGMLVLILALGSYLWATDDGEIPAIARCLFVQGGPAWLPADDREFEREFFGHTYRGHTGNHIDMEVYLFGAYEKPMLFAMRDVLSVVAPESGGVAIDVGANVGHHSIFLSRHAEIVHAIEPYPPVLARMRAMLEDNEIDNVVVHPVGFSDRPGNLPFFAPSEENLGTGSFSEGFSRVNRKTGELPLVEGDARLAEAGIERVDLIKVDIEGFERAAFEGLAETLEQQRPVVFFELNVHNEEGFHSEEQLRGVFPESYRFFELVQRRDVRWDLPGGGSLMCGRTEGYYELHPYEMSFDRSTVLIVALPAEEIDAIASELDGRLVARISG